MVEINETIKEKPIKKNVKKTENNDKNKNLENNIKKDVYLVEYYIKDLTIDKIIETNIEKHRTQSYAVVFYKDIKPILAGLNSTFPKVEDTLKNMKINDDKTLKLSPEESYGKRNKEFLKIIPFAVFKKSNLRPMVGLTIDIGNGQHGTIRSVSGGRVLVDFNSPYADHEIEFYLKLIEKPEGKKKIESILTLLMPSLKIKELIYENDVLTIDADKDKHKEEQIKGLEQIISGILNQYVNVTKINIDLK